MLLDGVKGNKKKLFVAFLKILRSVIRYPIGFFSHISLSSFNYLCSCMCKKNKDRNTYKQCEIN